jgi:hypothetical protein
MTKRKRKSNSQNESDPIGPKRSRVSNDNSPVIASQSVSHGRVDPTYGQRSAIPGLDDYDGHESGDADSEYGDVDGDALRYLKSVR